MQILAAPAASCAAAACGRIRTALSPPALVRRQPGRLDYLHGVLSDLLFGGYAYAHLSEKYLRPRSQALLHIGLLTAAMWLLPIAPDLSWKPLAQSAPTWRILCLLTVS